MEIINNLLDMRNLSDIDNIGYYEYFKIFVNDNNGFDTPLKISIEKLRKDLIYEKKFKLNFFRIDTHF